MKIPDIIKRIRSSLGLQKELPKETVIGIIHVLETMPDEEINCEELFARLDEYVDREVDQKDAAQIMPRWRSSANTWMSAPNAVRNTKRCSRS